MKKLKMYFQNVDRQNLFNCVLFSALSGVAIVLSIFFSMFVGAWFVGVFT
ncbi:MAG: hypothetical protein GXY86_03065 [Firmicutes bacterium]|nr:hypothetical protein [Bacillota bacterium]